MTYQYIHTHLLCLGLVLILTGCGRSYQVTQPVDGSITLDGVPLSGANLIFYPVSPDGSVAGGFSNAEGKFKIQTMYGAPDKGTTPGEYLVTVMKMDAVPTGKKVRNPDGTLTDETREKSAIPSQYTSKAATPIKVNIVKGVNVVEIKLVSR